MSDEATSSRSAGCQQAVSVTSVIVCASSNIVVGWWLGRLSHDSSEGWVPANILQAAGPNAHATFHQMEKGGTNSLYFVPELEG